MGSQPFALVQPPTLNSYAILSCDTTFLWNPPDNIWHNIQWTMAENYYKCWTSIVSIFLSNTFPICLKCKNLSVCYIKNPPRFFLEDYTIIPTSVTLNWACRAYQNLWPSVYALGFHDEKTTLMTFLVKQHLITDMKTCNFYFHIYRLHNLKNKNFVVICVTFMSSFLDRLVVNVVWMLVENVLRH